MRLTPYSPFLLDDWFEGHEQNFVPAIDVYQDNDNVIAETPLTGIDSEKVDISIENDVLSISGQSQHQSEVDEKNYYRKEVRYGAFHRSVALPASVDGAKAEASYDDGILKVVIPKEERAKPKKIKVVAKKEMMRNYEKHAKLRKCES